MKSLVLHPRSVIAGAVVTAVIGVGLAARQAAGLERLTTRPGCVPDPRAMLVIRQEQGPWTVPAGKLFMLSGLGAASYVSSATPAVLLLDSVPELSSIGYAARPGEGGVDVQPVSVGPCPPGFTAAPGAVLTVVAGSGDGRAWGYLLDR
jgi:hypothetical protein